jgi:hypothetical protein
LIQRLLFQREVDLAIGNDTDFSIVAGPHCLQVTKFKVTTKNQETKKRKRGNDDDDDDANAITAEITEIEIVSAFESVIASCREQLSIDATTTGKKVGGLQYTAAAD